MEARYFPTNLAAPERWRRLQPARRGIRIVNAVEIVDGMFSQWGIFFTVPERRDFAVSAPGVAVPVKLGVAADGRSAARRATGAKWTFRKGPFFSREQRR